MKPYAKVVVPGSPISKSNFKLHNKEGRAILPYIMLEAKILLSY